MGTPYNTLDRRIVLRLRDPLIMKFTCSNYIGEALSVNTSDYISTALFKRCWTIYATNPLPDTSNMNC